MSKGPHNYEFKTMLNDLSLVEQVGVLSIIAVWRARRHRTFAIQSEEPIAYHLIILGADESSRGFPVSPYIAIIGVLIYLSLLMVNAYTAGLLGLPGFIGAALAVGVGVIATALYVSFANWLAARSLSRLRTEMQ